MLTNTGRFFTLVAITILLPLLTLPLSALGEVVYEGNFDGRTLNWQTRDDGVLVPEVSGARRTALPGEFDLPARDLLLLVPLDRTVVSVQIEALATHNEPGRGSLAVAGMATINGEPVTLDASHRTTSSGWGELRDVHVWRGHRLVSVRVRPLRPAADGSGELEFLDAFAVNLVTGPADVGEDIATRLRRVPAEAADNREFLTAIVSNPEALRGYEREDGIDITTSGKAFAPSAVPSLTGSAVSYLIITNEDMAPEFERLAAHKRSLGLPAVVVTHEYITANFRHGVDLQETLRMFIREAYEMWGTEYVLLGGDSDILPPRYVNNSLYPPGDSTDIPVELYFAGLDGNWNANGNHRFGEPETTGVIDDEADFVEEVYLGRAPVSTVTHAATFVDKTIAYEAASTAAPWANGVLFAAEVLFPTDYPTNPLIQMDGAMFADEQYNDSILPCTNMDVIRLYETFETAPGDGVVSRRAFIDSLNSGNYGIVNHIGHGYYYNASLGTSSFNTGDADALTNGSDNPFVIYALNCASAGFHYSCLMERLIQNPDGGAVMAIGSVEAAFPVTSNNYQQEFFSELYCNSEPRAGKLLALSRAPFLGNTNINYTDRWTFENYTLLGDPALPLWTGAPTALTVTAPPGLQLGPQTIQVTVEDALGVVEGAIVTLMRDGEDYAQGVTDAAGVVSLDLHPVTTGLAELVVSGTNLMQYRADIPVTSGATYLAVTSVTVVDDGTLGSTGNGNGEPEAGETVALATVVSETGGGGATGLSGLVTTPTGGVTVVGGAVNYPDIGAGGAVAGDTPFLVGIAAGVIGGTPLELVFYVNSSAGNQSSNWGSMILAPELEVVVVDWDDSLYGNGDGLLGHNERITVTFEAKNYGAGRADAITAYLRTSNGNVALYDTVAVVAPLDLMDSGAGSVHFSMLLFNATRLSNSSIVLEDNYGRSWSHEFYPHRTLPAGEISTDASGSADQISLAWEPSPTTTVAGYNVYRGPTASGPFVRVNADPLLGTTYYQDSGLDQLTRYFYRVTALNPGLVESDPTAAVEQSTQPPELAAFPIGFGSETSGHLAVGDVDGRGGYEIIVGAEDVYVWHADGSELMNGDGDSQTNGPMTNEASAFGPAGIVLGHLDNIAGAEMIACENGNGNYLIHAYTRDGTEVPGWPKSTDGLPGPDWNWSTPAVGDIDGDGDNEVVVHTLNGRVWAWHHDGTEVRDGDNNPASDGVFYYRSGADWEYSMSGPALFDLDGDGALDIIFGTRYDGTGTRRVMALKYDGTDVAGFPVVVNHNVLCHPAIGDLNNDGIHEIVVNTTAGTVYVLEEDGSNYPGFPKTLSGVGFNVNWTSSPALGDMDGDGDLEIVLVGNTSGDDGDMIIIDTDVAGGTSGNTLPGWPVALPGSSEGSPVLADINGDGSVDIIHGIGGGSTVAPNSLYAFNNDGTMIDGFPIQLGGPLMSSATILDLDGDKDVDIMLQAWDRQMHVWDMPFTFDRMLIPWHTFQGNMQRTGVFFPVELIGAGDPGEVPAVNLLVDAPYPNPFNPSTSVRLYVPRDGQLRLDVYDVQGRRVRTLHAGAISQGWHTMTWDGRDETGRTQASGMYFMRAQGDRDVSVQKMTLLK
ncbi:hypothetical protein DRQ50_02555 [bacterium]|nr:MAG: hypothetical protein DRQ50_02555 [bacterium]